jgi:hypothetical protein
LNVGLASLAVALCGGGNFTSVRRLVEAIEAFVASWNQKAAPFEWTKAEVHQQQRKLITLIYAISY